MKEYYILLFISVVTFIIGFIVGFLFLICRYMEEKRKFEQQRPPAQPINEASEHKDKKNKKIKDIEKSLKQTDNEDNYTDENSSNAFKKRIVDMEQSWADTLDGITKEEFIKKNRSKQDNAYNFIKTRTQHNNSDASQAIDTTAGILDKESDNQKDEKIEVAKDE